MSRLTLHLILFHSLFVPCSVRLELALPEASEKGHGQCACTAISAALRALPSNLHLPAMALEWPAQAGIHQKQGTTHPCPDCQPRAAAQTALSQTGAEHPQTYQQHVILPGYKHMLAALATSLGGTLTVVCLEAKRLLQGYEEAVALGTSTGSDIHKVAGDAASQGVEGGSIAPAATIGVAEWQSMLTSLPRLQVLGLPDWGRHLSRGGPHTQPAGELLMSDIAQACHRLQRHLEIHVRCLSGHHCCSAVEWVPACCLRTHACMAWHVHSPLAASAGSGVFGGWSWMSPLTGVCCSSATCRC
jgi:hypothetical protein